MNLKEAMEAARASRLANSKEYDVPELGGKLRFASAIADQALANTNAIKAGANGAADPAIVAKLLTSSCINDDGTPFFASEEEARALLGAITLDTMNLMLQSIWGLSKPVEGAPPKGNSETSQSAA